MSCVVGPNINQRILHWEIPADPNVDFQSYFVYRQSLSGRDSAIILDYNQDTVVFNGLMSLIGDYWVCVNDSLGNQVCSDTLNSIFLNHTMAGGSMVDLTWTDNILENTNNRSYPFYEVYRFYTGNSPIKIAETSAKTYRDTIPGCAEVNYYVVLQDSSGCASVSNTSIVQFVDNQAPDPLDLDSVTVFSNGNAFLGWTATTEPDVEEYVVYNFSGGGWQIVDTTNGTSYVHTGSLANSQVERYRIAALDTCENIGILGPIHETMFLSVETDSCSAQNNLSWTPYVGFENGVDVYHIWVYEGTGSWAKLGQTTGLTFTQSDIQSNVSYCYKVLAWSDTLNENLSSTSNQACVSTQVPEAPDYYFIERVSVEASGLEMWVNIAPNGEVASYAWEWSNNPSGPFSFGQNLSPTGASSDIVSLNNQNPSIQRYFRLRINMDCGTVLNSEVAANLVLRLNSTNTSNELEWDALNYWDNGVDFYELYRRASGGTWSLIATLPAGSNSYSDPKGVAGAGNNDCYQLLAVADANANDLDTQPDAWSNEVCLELPPSCFMPNAFAPYGVNRTFKPEFVAYTPLAYRFEIYSRFGDLLFQSFDPNEAWDGTNRKGEEVPLGVYVYFLEYQDENNQLNQLRGSVTLLR